MLLFDFLLFFRGGSGLNLTESGAPAYQIRILDWI